MKKLIVQNLVNLLPDRLIMNHLRNDYKMTPLIHLYIKILLTNILLNVKRHIEEEHYIYLI